MISAPSSVSGGPIGCRPRSGARERAALALFVLAAFREHIAIAIRADGKRRLSKRSHPLDQRNRYRATLNR
jgi:hypothetical protein